MRARESEGMVAQNLAKEVGDVRWWHTIDLGHGVVTPGRDRTAAKLASIALPERLDGLTVLDVGAWDGAFSFEAERRGAARVLATDSYIWQGRDPYWTTGKAGFLLARRALGSRVEDQEIDVMELAPERVGTFDLVLFLGILYHMRHPLLALERVASVARDRMIVETHVERRGGRRPTAIFYPGASLAGDPTNWWGPNPAAVTCWLHDVGFRRVEIIRLSSWPYRSARAVYRFWHERRPLWDTCFHDRLVVHAWR